METELEPYEDVFDSPEVVFMSIDVLDTQDDESEDEAFFREATEYLPL